MSDYSELKRLAEAATPGPWECRGAEDGAAISHKHGWVADDLSQQTFFDTRYMAAANPAALLALIAENEKLQNKWVSFADLCAQATEAHDNLLGENVKLKAEVEALRSSLRDCSDSLHAEMLQKFGGQLPDDMHPVTRRDYDRDMSEVAGYRAAMSKDLTQ